MKKGKSSKQRTRKSRLMQAVIVSGAVFGMLNGAATFIENVPKVTGEINAAIYGPPVTFGEIEAMRMQPQW